MNNKFTAKKSLGQNFLKSQKALAKMLEAGEVSDQDLVLEVGPGQGALTEKLLSKAKKVIAIEKDDRLITVLQDKFADEIKKEKLLLISGDVLDFSTDIFNKDGETEFSSYKIIANIPYYITGQFLRKFLTADKQPTKIVVMVQKEIAQRIIANNLHKNGEKKESLLSISVKAYGLPKLIMKVDKENFSPAPKVDSAILAISDISKGFFKENGVSENRFFEILHAGFAHKRKILISNLRQAFSDIDWKNKFLTAGLETKIRAENLSLMDWKKII